MGERSILQAFVGDQPLARVEEKDPKRLVPEGSHRCNEIAPQLGVQRIDRHRFQISPHRFKKHIVRADEQERHVRICPEHPVKRFGRLRPDIAEAAKLGQQR